MRVERTYPCSESLYWYSPSYLLRTKEDLNEGGCVIPIRETPTVREMGSRERQLKIHPIIRSVSISFLFFACCYFGVHVSGLSLVPVKLGLFGSVFQNRL